MKILIAASSLYEFDTETREIVLRYSPPSTGQDFNLHNNKRPLTFGVTRWGENIICSAHVNKEQKIILLNKNFEFQKYLEIPTEMDTIHQIRVYDDELYIADTANDRLVIANLNNLNKWREISCRMIPECKRHYHVNFFMKKGDLLYIMCHLYGPSSIKIYQNEVFIKEIAPVGIQSHDIFEWNDKLWVCSSYDSKLITIDGSEEIQLSGFVRGARLTEDCLYVCMSGKYKTKIGEQIDHSLRHQAVMYFINPKTKEIFHQMELPNKYVTDICL